jgi:hypothetical protein
VLEAHHFDPRVVCLRLLGDLLDQPLAELLDRLVVLAGRRMTDEGVLVIRADRFRTQERNRDDARERLAELGRNIASHPEN